MVDAPSLALWMTSREPNRYPSQNVVMAPCNSDAERYPRAVAAASSPSNF